MMNEISTLEWAAGGDAARCAGDCAAIV